MNKEKKDDNNSRRNFLKLGLLAGAGTVATGAILATGNSSKAESGTKVKVLTTSGEVMEVDKNFLTLDPIDRKASHEGIPGRKFVMVIDLARCKNARKCVEECQKGHHLPKGEEFMKVYLMQDSEKSAPYWFQNLATIVIILSAFLFALLVQRINAATVLFLLTTNAVLAANSV